MKREAMVDTTELLLFDILQELKAINAKLEAKPETELIPEPTLKVEPEKETDQKITASCKYCGGIHENKGQVLACAKKAKKEGAKSDATD